MNPKKHKPAKTKRKWLRKPAEDGFFPTMLRGIWRTLCGAAIASVGGAAYVGYTLIPNADGYIAVARFALASVLLVISLMLMYRMGKNRKAPAAVPVNMEDV